MADITVTIQDEKFEEFKAGFLKFRPVPLGEDGEPTMSDVEWIKYFAKDRLVWAYKNGKSMIANEAIAIDNDIIE